MRRIAVFRLGTDMKKEFLESYECAPYDFVNPLPDTRDIGFFLTYNITNCCYSAKARRASNESGKIVC